MGSLANTVWGLDPTEGSFGAGSTDPNTPDPRFPNGTGAGWGAWAQPQFQLPGPNGTPKSGAPGTTGAGGGPFGTTGSGGGTNPFGGSGSGGFTLPGAGGGGGNPNPNPFGTGPGAGATPNPGGGLNFSPDAFGSWGQFLLDPQLQSGFSDALKAAIARYSDPNGMSYYSGPTVAGLTGDQVQSQAQLEQMANSGVGGTLPAANGAFAQIMSQANGGPNPQLDSAIQAMKNSAYQSFQNPGGPLQAIRASGLSDGAYGGSRQAIAEGVATGQLGASLANTEGSMRLQDLTGDKDRAASTLTQAGQLVNANMAPTLAMNAAGTQQQSVNQAILDSNLNAWKYNTTQPDVRLQNLYSALGASLPLGGKQTQQTTMPGWMTAALQTQNGSSGGNTLASILALLGAGGAFAGAFKGGG